VAQHVNAPLEVMDAREPRRGGDGGAGERSDDRENTRGEANIGSEPGGDIIDHIRRPSA
jgi:hypothetical protein